MVMRATLNDEKIKSLVPARTGKRYHVYEHETSLPGFGVRVTEKGPTSFILYARFAKGSPPARASLGKVGELTVGQARAKAESWLSMIQAGLNPLDERKAQQEAVRVAKENAKRERRDLTFGGLAKAYVSHKRRLGHRRTDAVEREIDRHLVSRWEKRFVSEVQRAEVIELVNELVEQGKRRTAHDVFGLARSMFAWAIDQGSYDIEHSPCDRIRPARLIGPKASRERALNDQELWAFWRASGKLPYPLGPFYRVLLLTGQRLSEVAGMRRRELHSELAKLLRNEDTIDWAEVPDEWKVWTIPRERFKSDTAHTVPLSDAVCAELAKLPRFSKGDHLFTFTHGEKPINSFGQSKARLDRLMLRALRAAARGSGDDPATIDLPRWVQHDLRHTVRSRLAALRIPGDVAELVIGHGKKGLERVYNQHNYHVEMREALSAWSQHLLAIAGPRRDNIVHLVQREHTQ